MASTEITQPTREEIEKWLRDALNHLYDMGALDCHPLSDLLVRPEEATGKRGQDLRKILIAAIQARKPARGTPLQSPDWRGYQILEQHILAGLSAAEVMQKLNISRSLFFLEKARILKVVFDDLWLNRIQPALTAAADREVDRPTGGPSGGPAADPASDPPPELSEAAKLLQNAIFEPIEICNLLRSVRPLIAPMAQAQHTRLEVSATGEGVIARGDRVLIRQVVLSLVAELLQLVPGGQIHLFSFQQDGQIGIQIEARKSLEDLLVLRLEERSGLQPETSYEIIRAMDGEITVGVEADGAYHARISWLQETGTKKLLLIDDHPDIAELFIRHLSGTGWEVVWAASADHARRTLAEMRPAVIVLDVILPVEDGWEFLISLKADPDLRAIPVLVCSAINEPDLVRSLGAQGYLPKPFTPAQLIQALSQWASSLNPSPATGH